MSPPVARPYQSQAIEDIRTAFSGGAQRVVFVLPTGGGKSFIASMIGAGLHKNSKRALYLGHRIEIVEQLGAAVKGAGVPCAYLIAGSYGMPSSKIIIGSIGTVNSRKHRIDWQPDLIFVDECHHANAKTWKDVIAHFPSAKVVGLTATPCRLDGRGLGEIFDTMVEGPHTDELIRDGYLCDFEVYAPSAPDLKGIHMRGGDYVNAELEAAMRKAAITGDAVKHYRRLAHNKSAVVFCVSIAHAEEVAQKFRDAGYDFRSIDGKMQPGQRRQLIDMMTKGKIHGLTSCDIISEGTDIPRIEVAILLRPTKSLGLFKQQCLDMKTEVLTKRGWLLGKELWPTDMLASWNVEQDKAEWVPIDNIVVRPLGDEPVISIKSPNFDMRVTAGHDLIVRARSQTSKRWVKEAAAQTALRRDHVRIPVSAVLDLPDYPIADAELEFVGWFLTDGSQNKKTRSVMISQSTNKPTHIAGIVRVLRSCGFKYGTYDQKKIVAGKTYSDVRTFSISHGAPRGTDKHLRGWGASACAPFLDKTIPSCFDQLSARQIGVLLSAMYLGDGTNGRKTITWTPATMSITTGDNLDMANRLQALLVMRGFRCNLATTVSKDAARKDQYWLHIKPERSRTLAGSNCKGVQIAGKTAERSRLQQSAGNPTETFWCASNRNGSLFIRRNGKVMIVGNCGRGLRPFPGKDKLIILDHAGNTHVHGLPDARIEWSLDGGAVKQAGERADAIRTCPKCFAIHKPAPSCPRCGHVYVVKGRKLEYIDGELTKMERGGPVKVELGADGTGKPKTYWDNALKSLKAIETAKGYKSGWAEHVLAHRQKTERDKLALAIETGVKAG